MTGFLAGFDRRDVGTGVGRALWKRLACTRGDGRRRTNGRGWSGISRLPLRLSGGICRGIQGGKRRDEVDRIRRGPRDGRLRLRSLSQGLSFQRRRASAPGCRASSDRRALIPSAGTRGQAGVRVRQIGQLRSRGQHGNLRLSRWSRRGRATIGRGVCRFGRTRLGIGPRSRVAGNQLGAGKPDRIPLVFAFVAQPAWWIEPVRFASWRGRRIVGVRRD